MKTWLRSIFLAIACGFFATGCASLENVDRSYANHPAMDLRKANDLAQPAPNTGLRNLQRSGGGSGCSVCAH